MVELWQSPSAESLSTFLDGVVEYARLKTLISPFTQVLSSYYQLLKLFLICVSSCVGGILVLGNKGMNPLVAASCASCLADNLVAFFVALGPTLDSLSLLLVYFEHRAVVEAT